MANPSESNHKWNAYFKAYSHTVKVFDGLKETLSVLNEQSILTGIVTSRTKEEFANDFSPFGLDHYFKHVICADDTLRHKPYPDPILKFIEITKTDPSEMLYIGDTNYDMDCALGANVDFALALWGAGSLKGMSPHYVFETPLQILEYVK